jgi:hypothetical protein
MAIYTLGLTGPSQPVNWDDFFHALELANIPSDFLNATERKQITKDRDALE